jgi:hypothetical protein
MCYCNGMSLYTRYSLLQWHGCIHTIRAIAMAQVYYTRRSCLSVSSAFRRVLMYECAQPPHRIRCISKWPRKRGEEQESYLGSIGICQQKKESVQNRDYQKEVHRVNLADANDEFQSMREQCKFNKSKLSEFVKHLMTVLSAILFTYYTVHVLPVDFYLWSRQDFTTRIFTRR